MQWHIITLLHDVETEAQRKEMTSLSVPGLNPGDLVLDVELLPPCPESNLKPQTGNPVATGHRAEGDNAGMVCTPHPSAHVHTAVPERQRVQAFTDSHTFPIVINYARPGNWLSRCKL